MCVSSVRTNLTVELGLSVAVADLLQAFTIARMTASGTLFVLSSCNAAREVSRVDDEFFIFATITSVDIPILTRSMTSLLVSGAADCAGTQRPLTARQVVRNVRRNSFVIQTSLGLRFAALFSMWTKAQQALIQGLIPLAKS